MPNRLTRGIGLFGDLRVEGGRILPRIARIAVTGGTDTGGGLFAWQPDDTDRVVIVDRVTLDVPTVATAACTVEVGTDSSATGASANLIDGLDVHSASGIFDNLGNGGTNGKTCQKLAAGDYVTGSVASGASAGLVAVVFVQYFYRDELYN